MYMTNKNVDI